MTHIQNIHENQTSTAQASCKASIAGQARKTAKKAKKGPKISRAEMQKQALEKALTNTSESNFETIFEGFAEMGIPEEAIIPRVNVFTFNAWKALGRVVRKGQKGVRVLTVIASSKEDEETGEEKKVSRARATTVFHISQTDRLDGQPDTAADLAQFEATTEADDEATTEADDEATTEAEAGQDEATTEADDETEAVNAYEARQEARREALQARAIKARAEANAKYSHARKMADGIPFGQPILVGHHSERRDRNHRERITNTFEKSFELQNKADHYEAKAASVGTGGISSDDPAAVKKLSAELQKMEETQERMKAANKAIRSHKTTEAQAAALVKLGFSEAVAAELVKGDFMGRVGFPAYALSNNNANMQRVKRRVDELKTRKQRDNVEQAGAGYVYREDTTENRVMFVFEGKPDEATREVLKAAAFKWSPSRGAWVRQLNGAGIHAAKTVIEKLKQH